MPVAANQTLEKLFRLKDSPKLDALLSGNLNRIWQNSGQGIDDMVGIVVKGNVKEREGIRLLMPGWYSLNITYRELLDYAEQSEIENLYKKFPKKPIFWI